jgi:hypothetical protein
MTRPLRRLHFRIWLALLVFLVAVFSASLIARKTTTPVNSSFHWQELR